MKGLQEIYQNLNAIKVWNGVFGLQNGKNMQNWAKNMKKRQKMAEIVILKTTNSISNLNSIRILIELFKTFHLRYYTPMWVLHSPCRFRKCDFFEYPNKMAAWPQREMTKRQKNFQKWNFEPSWSIWLPIYTNKSSSGQYKKYFWKG